jgi:hypothetical protein
VVLFHSNFVYFYLWQNIIIKCIVSFLILLVLGPRDMCLIEELDENNADLLLLLCFVLPAILPLRPAKYSQTSCAFVS